MPFRDNPTELDSNTDLFASALSISPPPKHHGNASAEVQFQRDVDMITSAIEKPGEEFSGRVLQRIYTLLHHGGLFYKRNHAWHKWNNNPDNMPLASALCHGSRVLIQIPAELNDEFLDWLFENQRPYRLAASHGIERAEEIKSVDQGTKKYLKEVKKAKTGVAIDMARACIGLPDNLHFGIDIALGGAGNYNEVSGNRIECNGEHGHLYICNNNNLGGSEITENKAGLLISIEPSKPSKTSQYGDPHGWDAKHLKVTATAGDNFTEQPENVTESYIGIKNLGPDEYYDSLFLDLTAKKFAEIKEQAKKFDLAWLAETRKSSAEKLKRCKEEERLNNLLQEVENQIDERKKIAEKMQEASNQKEYKKKLKAVIDKEIKKERKKRNKLAAAEASAIREAESNVAVAPEQPPAENAFFAFVKRNKWKILIVGGTSALLVGGFFTLGILTMLGFISGLTALAAVTASVSGGVAAATGTTASITTAVVGAGLVTTGGAMVGCSSAMVVGVLAEKATNSEKIKQENETISIIIGREETVPAAKKEESSHHWFSFFKFFHRQNTSVAVQPSSRPCSPWFPDNLTN